MTFKFFLTPFYIPDNYSPEAIALAEGLQELGHKIMSNIDYWYMPEENKFLFEKSDEEDYNVGIYEYKYLYQSKKWTIGRVDSSKINILIDRNDWLNAEWREQKVLHKFDFILADHLLSNVKYPSNVLPWAIGYTKRIERQLHREEELNFSSLRKEITYNFRVNHNLRGKLLQNLKRQDLKLPLALRLTDKLSENTITGNEADIHYYKQTAKRHNPAYYKMLNQSLATLAFGGYLEFKPFFYQPYNLLKKIARKPAFIIQRSLTKANLDSSSTSFVFQYDSFRMWESFYSITCPILLDMDYWKFKLPVMPIEGKHYLGIKKLDCTDFAKRIENTPPEHLMEIGRNGSAWVKENYSPKAVAHRLLKIIR